jgi:ABC-type glycerol-3-phosphate transport system substrate-binding protein
MFGLDTEMEDTFYKLLLKQNYHYWINLENKTAKFNDGKFANILNTAVKYLDNGWVFDNTVFDAYYSNEGAGMSTQQLMEKWQSDKYFYKIRRSRTLKFELRNSAQTGSTDFFREGFMGNAANEKVIGMLAGNEDKVSFYYDQAYCISANTKNRETAWEFLKFLAGYDMQLSAMRLYPINIQARADDAKISINGDLNAELNENQKRSYEAYMDLLEMLTSQINSYEIHDKIIDDMLEAEINNFFCGRQSAEQTATILQNRIGLYLSE